MNLAITMDYVEAKFAVVDTQLNDSVRVNLVTMLVSTLPIVRAHYYRQAV
jgi:hypothetical protein